MPTVREQFAPLTSGVLRGDPALPPPATPRVPFVVFSAVPPPTLIHTLGGRLSSPACNPSPTDFRELKAALKFPRRCHRDPARSILLLWVCHMARLGKLAHGQDLHVWVHRQSRPALPCPCNVVGAAVAPRRAGPSVTEALPAPRAVLPTSRASGAGSPLSASLCRLPDLVHLDVPSIHVELGSALRLGPRELVRRRSVAEKRDPAESESTAL